MSASGVGAQDASSPGVARLGDGPPPGPVGAGEDGELAGVVEAGQVADPGDDGGRHDPLHASQRLQGLDDGPQAPLRGEIE